MADIVLGIGTSHSPLLTIGPGLWAERAGDDLRRKEFFLADGRVVSYDQLAAEAGDRYGQHATAANFQSQDRAAQQALDRLADAIEQAAPDVLVVIGDDQNELFSTAHLPALAVYNGAEVVTHPKNEVSPGLPQWYQTANKGYQMDTVHRFPAAPQLADVLIDGMIDAGVEVAVASEVHDPAVAGFGHAFGFIAGRLYRDRPIPMLPIMLNTYFPPNVPRPARCYDIGVVMGEVIAKSSIGGRVGIVASGGLTHFAVDEQLDQGVIGAMRRSDAPALRSLPHVALRSGNSEILNWVMAAGALRDLRVDQCDYIPVHRTPAGSGIGLAFLTWQPVSERGRPETKEQS
jgi:Catalytic LigB subunit of aromatic ring-opening dioxygenase